MASLNRVQIMGYLGKNPDYRKTNDKAASVATINVGTTSHYKDSTGTMQQETEWHRIVLFGQKADVANQFLHKGSCVFVEGYLRTRKWQDNNGNDRYTTEIVANMLQMLDRAPKDGAS